MLLSSVGLCVYFALLVQLNPWLVLYLLATGAVSFAFNRRVLRWTEANAEERMACQQDVYKRQMLASKLVDVPGASSVLGEAYVTYSNEAKMRLLGVSKDTLRQFGAVSAQCAREMAEGARLAAGADFALSTTGIAGPDGGTPEKPVGLVYVGVASTSGCEAQELHLSLIHICGKTYTCAKCWKARKRAKILPAWPWPWARTTRAAL